MTSTLLLNADAQPISLIPISSVTWQEAASYIYLDDVEILHEYENWVIHSPSVSFRVPSVMMLRKQVSRKSLRVSAMPVKHLMFLRDNFTCQYCNERFCKRDLTIDHVLPRRYGGVTSWNNVTTACEPCNWNRGSDVRIRPSNEPVKPTYKQLLKNLHKQVIRVPHLTWNYYLGWPEERLIVLEDQHSETNLNFDFDAV